MTGIRSVFDVHARCVVDGKHWLWDAYTDLRGRPVANIRGLGGVKGIRITAVALGRDAERRPRQRWFAACGDPLCVSPKCLRLGSHADAHRAAGKAGRLKRDASALARAIVARGKRADVSPAWMVQWALESPQSASEVARCLGVDRSTVARWRRSSERKALVAGPFAQLLRAA